MGFAYGGRVQIDFPFWYFIVPVVLFVVGVLFAATSRFLAPSSRAKTTQAKAPAQVRSRRIMTPSEEAFYASLCRILPTSSIFPQVAFSALVQVSGKDSYATFNQFSQKRADFVICDPALNVVAIVELDDASHNSQPQRRKDAERDALLGVAGYRVVRVPVGRYSDSELLGKVSVLSNPKVC